jgi:putative ABC transport system ATP-binding protein
MGTTPILRLAEVSRVHGNDTTAVRALAGVSMEVHAGELVAVMGPSGSGKSTLLNLAGGLDAPTSGQVFIEGEAISSLKGNGLARLRRRRVGFVFQDFNLIPCARFCLVLPSASRDHITTTLVPLNAVGRQPLAIAKSL